MREMVIIEILTSYYNTLMPSELNKLSDKELLDMLLQLTYEYARS